MNTSALAVGAASVATVGIVVGLGALSLLVGAAEFFFGRPRLSILKTLQGKRGFAFGFKWNAAKEPAKFDTVKLRLFNPFGSPSQVEVSQPFDGQDGSFHMDIEMGPAFDTFINAQGFKDATVQVEVISTKSGITHHYAMKGAKFLKLMNNAKKTINDFKTEEKEGTKLPAFGVVPRDTIADTVPGQGDQLMIATNPAFASYFGGGSGDAAAGGGAAAENFGIAKVWIEDGCIVCNACEDIYPEVFKVVADGCIVIDGHPTDDGLKIEEAAEACPVEIIKFNKA